MPATDLNAPVGPGGAPLTRQVPAAAASRPPGIANDIHAHGPNRPQQVLHGLARLRRVVGLSPDATIDQVCEDAARMIQGDEAPRMDPPQLENDPSATPRSRPRRSYMKAMA